MRLCLANVQCYSNMCIVVVQRRRLVEASTLRVISRTPPAQHTRRQMLQAPSTSTSHWCWLASLSEVPSPWLYLRPSLKALVVRVDMTRLLTTKRVLPSSSSSTTLKPILSTSSPSSSCNAACCKWRWKYADYSWFMCDMITFTYLNIQNNNWY